MNTFEITLLTIATFFTIFLIYHIVIYGKFWKKRELIKKSNDLDSNSRFLLLLALSLIIIGLSAPFILTGKERTTDFVGSGEIGDTIGGIMNPFISIAAVIVTGLAFYMQYQANKIQIDALNEQKEQFRQEQEEQRKNTQLQRFESQFYEMLRLHKENVNEIEIKDTKKERIKGRNVFLSMRNEINQDFKFLFGDYYWRDLVHYYRHLFHIVKFVHKQDFLDEEKKLDYIRILRALLSNSEQEMLFYNWLSGHGSKWEEISIEEKILYGISKIRKENMINHFDTLDKLLNALSNKDDAKEKLSNIINKLKSSEDLSNDDNIYLEKLNNKIKEEIQNKNQFFTKYKMIHNIQYHDLDGNDISYGNDIFILYGNDILYENDIKYNIDILINRYKKLGRKDKLFEIDE